MPDAIPDDGVSLTAGGSALVTTRDGSIDGLGATGLFARDVRIVGRCQLVVDGAELVPLGRVRLGPAHDELVYGVYDHRPDPIGLVRRQRILAGSYSEALTIEAFVAQVELKLSLELLADGAEIYGLGGPDRPGHDDALRVLRSITTDGWDVQPIDDGVRLTTAANPIVGRHERREFAIALGVEQPPTSSEAATVRTSDHRLGAAVDRARWDLDALRVRDPRSGSSFLAAGAPHFLAAFGRDALLASLLSLSAGTDRAVSTLRVLAAWQGRRHDPRTLEEPGRIVHELRLGRMGVFGLDGGEPYYGSVDATPLFVVLLGACHRWGAGADELAPLLPAARSAMEWCRKHVDDDGFVVSIPHEGGIENQGWKDSGDSMVNETGDVIVGDCSLVEVQGYVYEAMRSLARLEREVAHDPVTADLLDAEASAFASRLVAAYEHGPEGALAMARVRGHGRLDVASSNPGHLLASDLLDPAHSARLADRLLADGSFSGWGVRTLDAHEVGYRPLGYHVGTVWPHDTALIMRGLTIQGFDDHAHRLADALLDLGEALGYEYTELIGGFERAELSTPVPYRASARPQAWSAAVPYQLVTTRLGLQPDLPAGEVRLRPCLEPGEWLSITGLRLGRHVVDIDVRRDGEGPAAVSVSGLPAAVDVLVD